MKILVVDDDIVIRELATEIFESKGHEVTVAKDGVEGISVYRHGEFDFVLTDYQMPRMNGHLLVIDIRKLNPTQKMAMASADPPTLEAEYADVPVLHKPFRNADLLALLN